MNEIPRLRIGGYEATPENASLFMFIGHTALENGSQFENPSANHVFIRTEEDGEPIGVYKFLRAESEETVQTLVNFMLNNGYPSHINLPEVPDCDMDAYRMNVEQNIAKEDIPDFLPDDLS